jgi:hypothetical protein
MLLLPIGYFLIIRMLFQSLFNESFNYNELLNRLDGLKPILSPIGSHPIKGDETHNIVHTTSESSTPVYHDESTPNDTAYTLHTTEVNLGKSDTPHASTLTTIKNNLSEAYNLLKDSVHKDATHLADMHNLKSELENVRNKITTHFGDKIYAEYAKLHELLDSELADHSERIRNEIKNHLDNEKTNLLDNIANLKNQYLTEFEESKKNLETLLANERNKHVNELNIMLKTTKLPSDVTQQIKTQKKSILTM